MREIERALLVALEQWVMKDSPPPPSVYPTLAKGTLVAANASAMHFPKVPALPQPDAIVNPLLTYDFGRDFLPADESGRVAAQPPAIAGVIFPLVPLVDADGNEIGGIHTVQQQAALGTYLGWNVTSVGYFKGQYCSLTGSYLPFAVTPAERETLHDPRLSIEERYGTHEGFVCAARRAADKLVEERFLLREDADRMIEEAAASDVLRGQERGVTNEATAVRLCSAHPAR
jgi:hypothetical protein